MRSQQRARGSPSKQQTEDTERDRQVTGAEDERPHHPQHPPILQLLWIRDLAGFHLRTLAHEHDAGDEDCDNAKASCNHHD